MDENPFLAELRSSIVRVRNALNLRKSRVEQFRSENVETTARTHEALRKSRATIDKFRAKP